EAHYAGSHSTHAYCLGGLIAASGNDQRAHPQACFSSCACCYFSSNLRPLKSRRQPFRWNAQVREKLGRPVPGCEIEQHRARAVGLVHRQLAGELESDVVLRQQHVARASKDVRLVILDPQDLCRGEPGQSFISADPDQTLPAYASANLVALLTAALI